MRHHSTSRYHRADIVRVLIITCRDLALALIGATVFGLAIGGMVARDMPRGQTHAADRANAESLVIVRELGRR